MPVQTEVRQCSFHGQTPHGLYIHHAKKRWRCKRCNADRVRGYRHRVQALIAAAGSECIRCGYNKNRAALVLHHRDPTTKKFNLSRATAHAGIAAIKDEIAKCDVVCANCHAEIEYPNLTKGA